MTPATSPAPRAAWLDSGKREGWVFSTLCWLSTWSSVAILAVLLTGIVVQAWGWLDWQFVSSFDSQLFPEKAGILAGIWGSFWTILITILVAVPVGVGAAVHLEEFGKNDRLSRIIQVNLSNLAGVPSIVYGILGLTVFARMFGLFGEQGLIKTTGFSLLGWQIPLPFGNTVVAGALTLALMILPVIIVSSQEALRAVPPSIRHAALALGATKWQTVRHQVLPAALPGIMTGVILAISRALGEAAPLILVGATTFVLYAPGDIASPRDVLEHPGDLLRAPFDSFTVMPIQIFNWAQQSQPAFQEHVAAAGIVVLLVLLLVLNATAIIVRNRSQRKMKY